MDDKTQLLDFLASQQYMTIAVTLDDGTPWLVPLRINAWEGEVFEWDSHVEAEHSKAIAVRPIVALSIYTPAGEGITLFGFYAQATAEQIREPNEHGVARYRATVSKCFINDASFKKREVAL